MFIIGHRGCPRVAPENTAESFEAALAEGLAGVELDVQLTRDGRALVHHDETTERLCGLGGLIRRRSLDSCRKLRVRGDRPGWKGTERLVSLDEALSILRPDVDVDIELKGRPQDTRPLARAVVAAVDRTGGRSGILITSAVPAMLLAVHRIAKTILMGVVFGSHPAFDLETLLDSLPISWVVPNHRHVTRGWVRRLHSRGLRVMPYTVNTKPVLDRVVHAGVDGVITDHPSRIRRWLSPPPRHRPLELTLAIDLGSTSAKVGVVSASGEIRELARLPFETLRGSAGEIGLDAGDLVRRVTRVATRFVREWRHSIDQVAVTSQRSTFVAFDPRTGQALGDAPSWRCARGASVCRRLAERADLVAQKTGLRLAPSYAASKMSLKLAAAAGRPLLLAPLPTFLLWHWSGGCLYITDPTLAARTLLMNLEPLAWDPELCGLFGIPGDRLPEIRPSQGDLGLLRVANRRLPLRAQAGDQQAALACLADSGRDPVLNLGTGGFLLAPTGSRVVRIPGLLSSVAWWSADGITYLVEGTIHRIAPSLEELSPREGLLALAEVLARSGEGGMEGTDVLPAREGLGSPFWDPRKRFLVRGSRDPMAVALGTCRAFAFLAAENLERLRPALPRMQSIRAGGGLAHNPHLLQIFADLLSVPVQVFPQTELSLLGIARMARGWTQAPEAPRHVFLPRVSERWARSRRRAWLQSVGLS
ncbi:MAG: glycerophosphodiester phosphodiesterase family protein [Planctomycetota bacterium]